MIMVTMHIGYSITIESLKSNYKKIEPPKFQGIQMPSPPTPKSSNPFDEFDDHMQQEEDFEDF